MFPARIPEGTLLVLLFISLSLKLALSGSTPVDPGPLVSRTFAAFLEARGFTVAPSTGLGETGAIRASSRNCALMVVNVAAQGWQRDVVRSQAQRDDSILFVFDGSAYAEQPVLLTWIDYYRARLVRSLQISATSRPVAAIIASSGCDLAGMSWPKVTIDN